MAKNKGFIKLNTKIRDFFGGRAFDEGIADVDDISLKDIISLLEIPYISDPDEMIRTLRRVWSEAEYKSRAIIVKYLTENLPKSTVHKIQTDKKQIFFADNSDKVLRLLGSVTHTKLESNRVVESFKDFKSSKITIDKIKNKLTYIRLQSKKKKIEDKLDIEFNNSANIQFYSSYRFDIFEESFHKELLTKSHNKNIDDILKMEMVHSLYKLEDIKYETISDKEQEIREFLNSLENHRYLSQLEIINSLKKAPIDSDLYHIPLTKDIVIRLLGTGALAPAFSEAEAITSNESYQKSIKLLGDIKIDSNNQIINTKECEYKLFNTLLKFKIDISYTTNFIYGLIWRGSDLPLTYDFDSVYEQKTRDFFVSINTLKEQMINESKDLNLDEYAIDNFILEVIQPTVLSTTTLRIKEKHKRTILYNFNEYIKPFKLQKLREELLANSIKDFKKLYPIARELNREIIFHVGETNSGKTYEAMEYLKTATTGYYLAPLRLLALEGYESLKAKGVNVSLITGEEEIIDEDSTHICSTIEMINSSVDVDVCVIDEIQMISDRDRGWAWANALIGVPASKVILTGSPDALEAVQEICEYLGEKLTVKEFFRKNELRVMTHPTSLDRIEKGTALISFSRKDVLSLKQQLSTKYDVSVVYGNLSPEVRREEARRFRDGESEILVSTDAISMGLNLPIKTILFAKDNKFDGLRRRELKSSEILQIAGRAGRYGLEDIGFVGALSSSALAHISSAFDDKSIVQLQAPFSIMASLEHILLISEILDTQNLLTILAFFADNMEFEGPFVAANIDSMLEIAEIVSEYELDLISTYNLSCAPASISSPYIESVFRRYIKSIEMDKTVKYIPPRALPSFAITNEMMLDAEDRVREISLYLWLSFKFPDKFEDTQEAIQSRVRLNQFIEESLKKGGLSKRCTKCSQTLDFSYKFSICEKCFNKRRRGRGRYRR